MKQVYELNISNIDANGNPINRKKMRDFCMKLRDKAQVSVSVADYLREVFPAKRFPNSPESLQVYSVRLLLDSGCLDEILRWAKEYLNLTSIFITMHSDVVMSLSNRSDKLESFGSRTPNFSNCDRKSPDPVKTDDTIPPAKPPKKDRPRKTKKRGK